MIGQNDERRVSEHPHLSRVKAGRSEIQRDFFSGRWRIGNASEEAVWDMFRSVPGIPGPETFLPEIGWVK